MGALFDKIRVAVENDRFVVGWHADQRCEERGVTPWQLAVDLAEARLLRERPASRPNPSVVVAELLPDGTEARVVWSWLEVTERAKLITVFFQD